MKVLHVCRSFSPVSETFVYDRVTSLARSGVEVHVATFARHNPTSRPFANVHLVSDAVPRWTPVRLYERIRALAGLRDVMEVDWRFLRRRLRAVVERLSPAVVHAHFGYEGVLTAPLATACGIPLIVSFYGYDVSQLITRRRWRSLYRELWPQVSAVTVLSEKMRRDVHVLGCPLERVQIVRLARDLAALPARGPAGMIRRFVSVGRLVEKKGHADAIRAIHRIARKHPDVRLRIVGEGPLHRQLQQLIDDLHLQRHVVLLGSLQNEQTLEEMAGADAFLLCSTTASDGDQEGTPTCLIEAQGIGLPCVSTTHAGIPEMVPEGNQWLLSPEGQIDVIASKLMRLLQLDRDSVEAIVARGRHFVLERHDLPLQRELLTVLYRQAIGSRQECGSNQAAV